MAFYAFYSYLNLKFELAPVYLNPALLIGLPGIRPRSISVFNLALKNDMGKVTQCGRELEEAGREGSCSTKFNTGRLRPEV